MVGISHAALLLFPRALVSYFPSQPCLGAISSLVLKILLLMHPCQKSSLTVLRKQEGLITSGSLAAANIKDYWKKKESENTGKAFPCRYLQNTSLVKLRFKKVSISFPRTKTDFAL